MKNATIKLDARKKDGYQITSQGFMVVDANLTRSGVFDYYEGGKLIREYRPPEEVFKDDSIESMKFVPLTKLHPDEMITADNWKQYTVGWVGNKIEKRGDYVGGQVIITDKKEIEAILEKWDKGESVELSMGYDAKLDEVPGQHKEGHYDRVQRDIVYNHGSIVPRGRAGREVRLIMDAVDEIENIKKDAEVKKVKIKKEAIKAGVFHMDALNVEVADDSAPVVEQILGKLDEAVTAISLHEDEAKAGKVKLDELQAKFDQLTVEAERLRKDAEEIQSPDSPKLQAIIKARHDIEETAKSVGVAVAKEDGTAKTSDELRVEIIAATCGGKFDAEGKSPEYIKARFDAACDMIALAKKEDGTGKLVDLVKLAGKKDAAPTVNRADEYGKKTTDLWKTGDTE